MSTSDRTTPLAGEYEMNHMPGQRQQEGISATGTRGARTATLQERVQESVSASGELDIQQISALVQHEAKMQNEYSRMRHLIASIGLMMLIFGVVSAFVAKQLIDNHKTTDTHDGTLVSANGDFVVSTAEATRRAPLSSFLSDAALRELKVLALSGPNEASVHMKVLGFVRLPKQPCRHSLVKLFTAAGVLLLDGEQLTFDTGVSHVVAEAGFDHVINTRNIDGEAGRHLLASGLGEIIGMFNFVGKFTDDGAFRAAPNDECEDRPLTTFAGVPESFTLKSTGYIKCSLPASLLDATAEAQWCTDNGAVPHPAATETSLTGLYFTQSLELSHDRAAQRTIVARTSSWDPLQRTELQVEDEATSMLKSAQAIGKGADRTYHNCAVGQLPIDASIFDSAKPETARVISVDGEPVFAVKVSTYMSDLRLDDGKLAVDLELRVWTDSTGAWTRFQVFDAVKDADATSEALAVARAVGNTVEVSSDWTDQKFFDVTEMIDMSTSKTPFDDSTFKLDFTGRNKACVTDRDSDLPPLDRHPSHTSSSAYLKWRAEHVANPHAGEREVEYDAQNFVEPDVQPTMSPTSRRLMSQAAAQVDRAQLVNALSSYSDDAAVVDQLANGVQEQIDNAVARALHAYETGEERAMPALKRARGRRAMLAAVPLTDEGLPDEETTLSPASRALTGSKQGSKCYNADWWAARLKFNGCYHKNNDIDLSLKWKVTAPNVPVVGVSIAANVDLVLKKEHQKRRPSFKGGGCVQFTIGADALPSIVNKGCQKIGYSCTFELAKICIKYDSDSNAITGMASVGPSRLQVVFKIHIPVRPNAINNVKGWVTADLMIFEKDYTLVDYDF